MFTGVSPPRKADFAAAVVASVWGMEKAESRGTFHALQVPGMMFQFCPVLPAAENVLLQKKQVYKHSGSPLNMFSPKYHLNQEFRT